MKRKIAIWLLKQFPVKQRRDIVMQGIEDLNHVKRREFLDSFLPVGFHSHRNPAKKVAA